MTRPHIEFIQAQALPWGVVHRNGTRFQETLEALPASGHVVDRAPQVVFRAKRRELVIHPVFEFLQQRTRTKLALFVTPFVRKFPQFIFDIEQLTEVSHGRRGSLRGTERMQLLELAAGMRMATSDLNPALYISPSSPMAGLQRSPRMKRPLLGRCLWPPRVMAVLLVLANLYIFI